MKKIALLQWISETFRFSKTRIPVTRNSDSLEDLKRIWRSRLQVLSNEELIKKYNECVGKGYYHPGHEAFLKCIRKEILIRPFDSDILFEFDEKWRVKTFKLSQKVKLEGDKLEYWKE